MNVKDIQRLLREAASDCCRAAAWLDRAGDGPLIRAKIAASRASAILDRIARLPESDTQEKLHG